MKLYLILLLALSSTTFADKFTDNPMAAASPEGTFIVKTVPNQDGVHHFAHVYKLNGQLLYDKVSEFMITGYHWHPTEVLIADNGNIFTASTRMGTSQFIAYTPHGKVLKKYSLEELFSTENQELLKQHRSVSNDHWMCRGFKPWIFTDTLMIKDAIGGYFSFDVETAEFIYQIDSRPCPERR